MASTLCPFCGRLFWQAAPTMTRALCPNCRLHAEGVSVSRERTVPREPSQRSAEREARESDGDDIES